MRRYPKAIIAVMVCLSMAIFALFVAATWIISAPDVSFYPSGQKGKISLTIQWEENAPELSTDYSSPITYDDLKGKVNEQALSQIVITGSDGGTYRLYPEILLNNRVNLSNGIETNLSGTATAVGNTYLATNYAFVLNEIQVQVDAQADKWETVLKDNYEWSAEVQYSGERATLPDRIVKYKTVQANNTWYTIEDALAASGDVTVKADTSFAGKGSTTEGIPDVASRAGYSTTKGNYTVANGGTLLLPHSASDTGDYSSKGAQASQTYNKNVLDDAHWYNADFASVTHDSAYVTLTVPANIAVEVSGSLIVGGKLQGRSSPGSASSVVGEFYSQLELKKDSTVTIQNKGIFNCLGFAFGDGKIIAKNGAKVVEPFSMPGWPGGSAASALMDNIFPLNQYALANIEAHLKVYQGATYSARAIVTASKSVLSACCDIEIEFISSESNSLLTFGRVNENDYIEKYIESGTGRIHLSTHGEIQINNIVMDLKVDDWLLGSVLEAAGFSKFSTEGKQVPIPGCISINACKDSTVEINRNVQIKLLPGAEINAEVGSNIILDSGSAVYAYGQDAFKHANAEFGSTGWSNWQDKTSNNGYPHKNAPLIYRTAVSLNYSSPAKANLNGTVTVSSGATLAVYAESATTGATITYQSGSMVSGSIAEAISASAVDYFTLSAKGNLYGGKDSFEAGRQYKYNGTCWVCETNQINVTYDANGGTFDGHASPYTMSYNPTDWTSGNNWQGTEATLAYGKMPTPTRAYYTFVGWSTDPTAKPTGVGIIQAGGEHSFKLGDPVTLYAVWAPIEYKIQYTSIWTGEAPTEQQPNYEALPQTFRVTDANVSFAHELVLEGYNFVGIYTDNACTPGTDISKLTGEQLVALLQGNTVTLYVQWAKQGLQQFNISYENTTEVAGLNWRLFNNNGTSVYKTEEYSIWVPDGYTLDTIEETIRANTNCSHDFLGWYIDGTEQKVATFQDIIGHYAEDDRTSIDVKLVARWEAKLKVTIQDKVASYDVTMYLHAGGIVTNNGYDNKNSDPTVSTYFVKWQLDDSDFTGGENSIYTYTIPSERTADAPMNFVATRASKAHVTVNDSKYGKILDGYYQPNTTIEIPKDAEQGDYDVTVDSYFNGWEVSPTGAKFNVGDPVSVPREGDFTINSIRAQKVVLTVTVTATGKEGSDGWFGGGAQKGDDVTAKATVSFPESSNVAQTVEAKGEGGTGKGSVGKTDTKPYSYHLKPGQKFSVTTTYTTSWLGGHNDCTGQITCNDASVTLNDKKDNHNHSASGTAEEGRNITITVSNS